MLSIQLLNRVARMLRVTRQIDDTAPGPHGDFIVGIFAVTIRDNELNPNRRFPRSPSKTRDAVTPL
ncbi:hypothetical protein GCM10009702_22400 [Propioniferax innocua]